jgi:hypothetical protein
MVPDRGLSMSQDSGVKGKKTRLTYAFTTNADGSEKLPAFIIGKAYKPRPFEKKTGEQLGFYYRNNAKAWMTAKLYQEWLSSWDRKLRHEGRHIVLLQDNFKGHIPPDDLTNISVENFEPNLTAHVQPAEAGIIRCFRAHYRARYIQRAIARYDEGITPAKSTISTSSMPCDLPKLRGMRSQQRRSKTVGAKLASFPHPFSPHPLLLKPLSPLRQLMLQSDKALMILSAKESSTREIGLIWKISLSQQTNAMA